jgi:hypothetical protein
MLSTKALGVQPPGAYLLRALCALVERERERERAASFAASIPESVDPYTKAEVI